MHECLCNYAALFRLPAVDVTELKTAQLYLPHGSQSARKKVVTYRIPLSILKRISPTTRSFGKLLIHSGVMQNALKFQ